MIGKTNANAEAVLFERVENIEQVVLVTFPAAGWSAAAPYTQTVSASGITAESQPVLYQFKSAGITEANATAYNKAFAIIAAGSGITGNGTVTWRCFKKPATDITVALKGV